MVLILTSKFSSFILSKGPIENAISAIFVLFFLVFKYNYLGKAQIGWVAPQNFTFPGMAQMQDTVDKPV